MTARLRSRHSAQVACPVAGCPTRCVLADSVGPPALGIWICPEHNEFGPGVNEWDGSRLTPDPPRVPSPPRQPFIPITSRECEGRHGVQLGCCPECAARPPVPLCRCGHDLTLHDPDEGLCGACGCPAWRVA